MENLLISCRSARIFLFPNPIHPLYCYCKINPFYCYGGAECIKQTHEQGWRPILYLDPDFLWHHCPDSLCQETLHCTPHIWKDCTRSWISKCLITNIASHSPEFVQFARRRYSKVAVGGKGPKRSISAESCAKHPHFTWPLIFLFRPRAESCKVFTRIRSKFASSVSIPVD